MKVAFQKNESTISSQLYCFPKSLCLLGSKDDEKGHKFSTLRAFQCRKRSTGDEYWVQHYDAECKTRSMENRHKTSQSPRKFKVVASARKPLLTVFWNKERMVNMDSRARSN
ncbi:transposase [Elysia marginata]|uniref:Transposase n=1 Tax=Elysia marginata TaxID=1093978 RepID=A0AAV4FTS4_9GAST|nr:transposase [Elysia marginata]